MIRAVKTVLRKNKIFKHKITIEPKKISQLWCQFTNYFLLVFSKTFSISNGNQYFSVVSFLSTQVRLSLLSKAMSVKVDSSAQTRPYTVGVSFAFLLIFLIAMFHVWRYIFKEIKKCVREPEIVPMEIPISNRDRRISSPLSVQQTGLKCEDDKFLRIKLSHKQRRQKLIRSSSDNSRQLKTIKKNSSKRHRRSTRKQSFASRSQVEKENGLKFLAGYSHLSFDEDFWKPWIWR